MRGERRRDDPSEDRFIRRRGDDENKRNTQTNASSQFLRRPMRGGERREDPSEDRFLRKFDLRDDDDEDDENSRNTHKNASAQFLRRPMRGGEKRDGLSEDRSPRKFDLRDEDGDDDDQNMRNAQKNSSLQFMKRPLRGEKRDGFNHLKKFDFGDEDDGVQKARKTQQGFSTQLPKETVREKEEIESDDLFNEKLFKLDNDVEDKNMEEPERNLQSQMQNRPMKEDNRGEQFSDVFSKQSGLGGDVANKGGAKTTHQNPSIQLRKTEADALDSSPQDADEIFRKMKETGLIPNAVAMLDGLCKDGLIQEAMKLFGLMREKGTIPEVVIYTAVVEGFCKAAKFHDAEKIFRKMQNNGISPNAFSYTVLIQGLCKGRELEDSVSFCVEMLEAGHSPNVATFVTLIDLICREKGQEEAASVIGRLREKGFAMDDKAVREHLDKKGPFSSSLWEVIFGKKNPHKLF
ncbi:hypothetical protein AAC387_Pa07g2610 [Persea americana]